MEAVKFAGLALVCCWFVNSSTDAARIPAGQEDIDDDNATSFFLELVENLKSMMKSGIESAGIPPLDPLIVDQDTEMDLGKGTSKITLFVAKGFTIDGLAGFEVQSLRTRTKQLYVNATGFVPKVVAQGNYEINGKILFAPITGDGDFFADVEGIRAQLSVSLVQVDGHYQAKNFHLDFTWDKLVVNLENILDPALSPIINKIINGMGARIYERFKPIVRTIMNQMMPPIFNNILGQYTIDEIKSGKFVPKQ